jgi:glycosyltransferase involved in cell wall biosynthesis
VVLPVYNEEGNLRPLAAELLPALQALGRGFEVIFVDDGSTDRSLDVIRDLGREHPGVRHIALDGNHGQSAAFLAGFAAARAPVTVTMDADGQNDPADVAGLLDVLDRAAHQGPTAVVGWRARRRDSVAKRLGSRVGNLVRNLVTGHAVRDTGCSLKAMPTHLLQRLPAFDGMHRFLPTLLAARGAAIIEVRVNHRPRSWGVSKYSNLRRALVGLADVFGVRWLNSRAVTCRVRGRDEAS